MSFEKYRIKKGPGDIETHHVFLDTLAHNKEAELGISEKKFEVPLGKHLIYLLFAGFFLLAFILFAKTFYLQVWHGKQLAIASENNKGKINLVNPDRGIIYDINGKKLVVNAPDFNLVCDKRNFVNAADQSQEKINQIATTINKTPQEVSDSFASQDESKVLVMQNIPQETLLVLEAKIKDLPDCQIEKNTIRNYAMGAVFSHVLGYTGLPSKQDLQSNADLTSSDNVGKSGLEKQYDDALRGTPGKIVFEKSPTGKGGLIQSVMGQQPGYNLVLNIDANLQKAAYEALEKSLKNIGSKKGAVVVMNPNTGAVLAMVSYPAYDDNIFSNGISQADFSKLINDPNQPFFNRAISAQYPTGSTIKPFEATAALQENIISPTKIINDPGYILVHSQYNPEVTYKYGGVTPHGLVDMRKAIAVSSNIYFYTVGGGYGDQKGLGPGNIKKYLDLYGWEQKTGIDLPGEYPGFVPTPSWKKAVKNESWWDGDTYNLSIGQSDLQVTPIQVAAAYSYIANGGTLYKPQIVNKIVDGSGKNASIIQEFKPEIVRQNFIDAKNLQVVREGMRDGVAQDYGSSHMLADVGVSVAAKTGTAEIGRVGVFNTWSTAFAPYDNPQIVVVSTIEEVQGLRAATLPVTHDILKWYFSQNK